ncbi:MAG: hypothetical protein AAB110_01835, partial [Candidatus Desantisbacteria bacterium]
CCFAAFEGLKPHHSCLHRCQRCCLFAVVEFASKGKESGEEMNAISFAYRSLTHYTNIKNYLDIYKILCYYLVNGGG